jgi:asparagine synthase (glutamine-hydrolysing)
MWADHLKGQVNMQYLLWCVLMFQAWLEAQSEQPVLRAEAPLAAA